MAPPRPVLRPAAHVAALLLGGVVCLAALMVHRSVFPFGLLLALVTSVALPWRLLVSRLPRSAAPCAVGWLVVFGIALRGRPEGDFVLAQDLEGYSFTAVSLVVLVLGVVSLAGKPRRSA